VHVGVEYDLSRRLLIIHADVNAMSSGCLLHGGSDFPHGFHERAELLFVNVEDVAVVCFRNHEYVTLVVRINIEKCVGLGILVDLLRGYFAFNYLEKQVLHALHDTIFPISVHSMTYALAPLPPDDVTQALISFPPLLRDLLFERGITTSEEAAAFLEPSYETHLHDPFLMKDLDRAVMRTLSAMQSKERIALYTDYDCDGIPAAVLLRSVFRKIGYEQVVNYIPHRHEEGYGLNVGAVEKLAKDGVSLMITADCGITDNAAVARAQELNMDVILTDHHLPQGDLPPAFAVLNPKRTDDTYPEPMLCGSGVAFKFAQGLLKRGGFSIPEGWEKWLLDMAGLATVADMVPLTGENRAIAHFGLKVLRKSPRVGFQELCRIARVNQRFITEDDIGFMLSPRINAASRMGEPMQAFELLITEDAGKATVLAAHLNKLNDERKGHVASMSRDIKKRIEARRHKESRELIVLGDPRWRPGLLGLTANSIMETYRCPVFLWGREGDGTLKGSCRSDGSVNVVELMAHTAMPLPEGFRSEVMEYTRLKRSSSSRTAHSSN
jgi:single-stranded-DNA-specific exonuclease